MMTKEMWEKLSKSQGLYHLNLSDKTDREFYLEQMGGEGLLRRKYPRMYSAFHKGWERAENQEAPSAEVHLQFIDSAAIVPRKEAISTNMHSGEELYYLKTKLDLDILDRKGSPITADIARTFQADLSGEVFDPDSYSLSFMTFEDCLFEMNHSIRQYQGETLYHKEQFDNRILMAYVAVNVYDEDNVLDPYIYTQSIQYGVDRPFQNIYFEAPHSDNYHNEIRILYGRSAKNLSDPDYIYKSNDPDQHDGMIKIIVPIKGMVELKSSNGKEHYYSFSKLTEHPQESPLHLKRSTMNYNNEDWKVFCRSMSNEDLYAMLTDKEHPRFTVEKKENHGDILRFDLFRSGSPDSDDYYDWEDSYLRTSKDDRERICYLSGGFEYDIEKIRISDGKVLKKKAYQIECKSVDPDQLDGRSYYTYEPGSQVIYIPPLHLWWGCHARDTRITMADGTKRRADEIRIGDRLLVYGGRTLVADNIYIGMEKELFHVITDTGNQLKISAGHPLLREDGSAVPVEMIQAGDAVLAGDGSTVHVKEVKKERYEDEVYNFSFEGEEGENYVVAEGLYSGDMYAQNRRACRKKPLSGDQEELVAEMKRFREEN